MKGNDLRGFGNGGKGFGASHVVQAFIDVSASESDKERDLQLSGDSTRCSSPEKPVKGMDKLWLPRCHLRDDRFRSKSIKGEDLELDPCPADIL
jgi:hypothetical protein